jgi:hypothetical protein
MISSNAANSYTAQLNRARQAQAQDLEILELEEPPINTVSQSASALQVQQRTEKDEKKLDHKVRDTLQEANMSKTQHEHYKTMMEMERNQRLVMMQEISSIHCSGTRDKNTR